jgi:hypothetical protein
MVDFFHRVHALAATQSSNPFINQLGLIPSMPGEKQIENRQSPETTNKKGSHLFKIKSLFPIPFSAIYALC